MDKGCRSLLTLSSSGRHPLLAQRRGSRTIVTKPPSKNIYEASKLLPKPGFDANDSPFFLSLRQFKNKIAVTDKDGDFTYEELFKRSFYLSLEIKKALRGRDNRNQKINLICPNGVSYIIGQWAIWMSGNVVVPLSGKHTDAALEYYIKDSDSALVISAPALIDKVENVVLKMGKPLICQDPALVAHTNIDIEDMGPFPSLIFDEKLYPTEDPVMMLYYPGSDGKPQRLHLKHKDINRELDLVNRVWNLDEHSSLLHAISLYNPYGIIASLMGPLSVGGRVVLLPQFETLKVWSYLLGIQINGEYVPRTNLFAGVPDHYDALMKRYTEVFTDRKIKNYVYDTCSSRINLMVNGVQCLDNGLHKEWTKITGHTIALY